jgi:Protein of unknown function (DUF3159)
MTDDPGSDNDAGEPLTFKEAMADAARKSRVANGVAVDAPLGTALLGSVGGVRGIVESVLPTLVFLVLHLIFPQNLVLATLVPLAVAVIFVIARLIAGSPASPAITGAVILGITAVLAIVTNRAENNFIPGILLNAGLLLAMLVSLAIRQPLVGVFVSFLLGEQAENWRSEPAKLRALTLATWLWTAMFAIRLAIEVPLYLAANASGLAITKIILGVPLYAVVLLLTWLLIRAVFPPKPAEAEGEPLKVS